MRVPAIHNNTHASNCNNILITVTPYYKVFFWKWAEMALYDYNIHCGLITLWIIISYSHYNTKTRCIKCGEILVNVNTIFKNESYIPAEG